MTDRSDKPGFWKRLGLDWIDIGGLLALGAITAGAWLEWRLSVALLVFGGVLGAVVLRIIFAKAAPPDERRR